MMTSIQSWKCGLFVTAIILLLIRGGIAFPDATSPEFKQSIKDESLSSWEKFSEFFHSIFKKPVFDFHNRDRRSSPRLDVNQKNVSGGYKAVGISNHTEVIDASGQNNDSDINPKPEHKPFVVFGVHSVNATAPAAGTELATTTTLLTSPTNSATVLTEPVVPRGNSNVINEEPMIPPNSSKIAELVTMQRTPTSPNVVSTRKTLAIKFTTRVPSVDITTEQDNTVTESQTSLEAEVAGKPEPTDNPRSENEVKPEPKSLGSSPEPTAAKGAEPKPTSTMGADPEPSSAAEAEPEVFAATRKPFVEPVPVWYEAKLAWGPAWEFHIYFVGLAFAILAVYSVVSILRLWQKKQLLSQGFFIAVNVVLAMMGIFRAVYFLIDGYNSHEVFSPDAVDYFVYTIGFPFLTSAFCILFLALLQTTKVQFMSPRIQSSRILAVVISAHLILSVTTDAVVGSIASARALMFVCQLVSVMWGILLFAGYFYIFKTLYSAALRRQKDLLKLSLGKLRLPGIKPIHKPPRLTLGLGVKVTLVTAITGLLYAALQMYAMIGVYGVFSKSIPAPWPWWCFKFSLRILELVMCFLMSYVATQPFRYQKRPNRTVCDCFCWAPCHAICEGQEYETKEDSIYWNEIHGVSVSYSQELDPGDPSQVTAAKYMGSPDESIPLSSEEEVALQKSRSNTIDSDYGDLDLGSGPIVLNPHVLYQRNPELLSLREGSHNETKLENETKLDEQSPIKMPHSVNLEDNLNGETDNTKFASQQNENVQEQKADTPNRKVANRPSSLKAFLPRSPMKGNFPFLHSKAEQAGYSNLDNKIDPKKAAPVKRSVSDAASSVRTKSHQGSNYLSLSDLEVHSGVLDTAECKSQGQEMIPKSPTILEESEEGKTDQKGNINV
ncbi:uncharacterized protein LOC135490585 [Lineus longissimus]|uniref:uncharacterized protein LOC135490585 n=1 Tax=Lineus longissimus TaxID=88925 RepID=UPI002B4F0816